MLKRNNFICMFLILITISTCILLFSGCVGEVKKNEFNFKSWKTIGYGNSKTLINIEFDTIIENGTINLYLPSGDLIDSKTIGKEMKNVSFIISNSKSYKPQLGNYQLIIKEKEFGTVKTIMVKDLYVKDSNISIIECIPIWDYHEGYDYFELEAVNLTLKNFGDVYGFIWEGRVIIDNLSIFLAPDYHWHDLNLWFMSKQEISLELPVDVPWLMKGSHFIKIFMQDSLLNTVASYESTINTPWV